MRLGLRNVQERFLNCLRKLEFRKPLGGVQVPFAIMRARKRAALSCVVMDRIVMTHLRLDGEPALAYLFYELADQVSRVHHREARDYKNGCFENDEKGESVGE